ncbi:hypothetical protein BU16DRAFT_557453 [Lophium mytilinum]|uniref:Uncharacterized protein n=1 Tax=Lophium mytilinum TaxID=390894 RepID=A0A6A6R3J1_9PEZI|nr:hypothetical protein BU16DRAFT_557453 [Lophium mytilinum]
MAPTKTLSSQGPCVWRRKVRKKRDSWYRLFETRGHTGTTSLLMRCWTTAIICGDLGSSLPSIAPSNDQSEPNPLPGPQISYRAIDRAPSLELCNNATVCTTSLEEAEAHLQENSRRKALMTMSIPKHIPSKSIAILSRRSDVIVGLLQTGLRLDYRKVTPQGSFTPTSSHSSWKPPEREHLPYRSDLHARQRCRGVEAGSTLPANRNRYRALHRICDRNLSLGERDRQSGRRKDTQAQAPYSVYFPVLPPHGSPVVPIVDAKARLSCQAPIKAEEDIPATT